MTGRIDRLKREHEVEIRWIAFPLHPHTPEEGLTLKQLFRGRGVDIEQVKTRLKKAAEEAGLPLSDREKTYNSRRAQELGKWAESQGKGDDFHHAVFRAYFVDGTNIAGIPHLLDIAASVGLDAAEAKKVLETRAFRETVDSDWSRCHALGITAVPTFLMGERCLIGAQSYEVLEKLVALSGVKRRPSHC